MSVTVGSWRRAWWAAAGRDDDFRATWADTPQAALSNLADTYESQCEWFAKKAEEAAAIAAEARRMAKEYEHEYTKDAPEAPEVEL